jgi:RNA polymerase sigma-70 factor (ECF subfamily)
VKEGVGGGLDAAGAKVQRPTLDPESSAWLEALRDAGAAGQDASRRLHALLLAAARFQLRRRATPHHLRGETLDEIATEAADDALIAVLAHLDDFRGASRFTTWAYKFAIFETSVSLRKRLWKGRELPIDGEAWQGLTAGARGPDERLEQLELLGELKLAVDRTLTERQRDIFVAVALNDVPIDVVAARFATTRGAIYKSLHDARRKLRAALDLGPEDQLPAAAAPIVTVHR